MSANQIFELPAAPTIPIVGNERAFPIRRIFCVGRNYVAHAVEMGAEVDREAPFYFTKSAWSFAVSGQEIPYPPGTEDYHHEVELAVAIGADAFRATPQQAMKAVWGYGCALDMTRRDRQQDGKDKRRPWDLGKDVEGSAVFGALTPVGLLTTPLKQAQISLSVNGKKRQQALLADMVWPVPELIAHLSQYYHLAAGDLILTGTPAGVGPVVPGDRLHGEIDGLDPLTLTIGNPE